MLAPEELKKIYLFENLTTQEIEVVLPVIQEKKIVSGDYIFDEGSHAASLFVILNGTVDILKKGRKGEDQAVIELAAGSHFGEMAFLDYAKRAASAMAKDNVVLLEIQYTELDRIIHEHPEIGLKFFKAFTQVLCRRIRHTTTSLSALKELRLRNL